MAHDAKSYQHVFGFLQTIIDAIPTPIFYKNLEGVYLGCNKAFVDAIGRDLLGKTVFDAAPKEFADKYSAMDDELIRSGGRQEYEYKVRYADNTLRDVIFNKAVYMDESGEAVGIVGIMTDITARNAAEGELKRKDHLCRTLVENTKCVVWEYEFAIDRFTYVSPQALSITGYAPEEWKNFQSWLDMIDPRDRVWAPAFCADKTKEGVDHEFEYRLIRKDGSMMWMRDIAAIIWEDGKVKGLRGFLIDITEIKKAEEELEASKNMLKLVLDSIPVRVFWKDLNSKYLGCNAAFAKDAGRRTPEELIGRDDYDFTWKNEADAYRHDDRIVMDGGVSKLNFEEPQSWPDGTRLVLRTSKIPLRDKSGKVFGVLGTYEDITAQKIAEEELRKAKILADSANKAKSAFLATMSHEIRTPLTAILGISDILMESGLTKEQLKKVEVLKQSGDTLLALVNEILDFSKVESGHIDMHVSGFNIGEMVRAVGEMMRIRAAEKGVELSCSIDEAVPEMVEGAGIRIKEVLINLISNAVKFTESGGKVSLMVLLDRRNRPGTGQDVVVFKVADTGAGIADNRKHLVFEPFVSDGGPGSRGGGTGLGLAITRRLVELMGGNIWFETVPGEGSVFVCSIPLTVLKMERNGEPVEDRAEARVSSIPVTGLERKLLIAEDSEPIREVMGYYFKDTPYKVDFAKNGEVAVDMFKSNAYDAVLLDLEMPLVSGYEAAKLIRAYEKEKNLKAVPIIALSAHALKEHEAMSRKAGCDMHVTKPVKRVTLFEAIERCLADKSAS